MHERDLVRPAERWIVAPDVLWTTYPDGDDWVAYNPASADLHLVTASARELWAAVAAGGHASIEDLSAALATRLGRPLDADVRRATEDVIRSMDHLGLLRPAP